MKLGDVAIYNDRLGVVIGWNGDCVELACHNGKVVRVDEDYCKLYVTGTCLLEEFERSILNATR